MCLLFGARFMTDPENFINDHFPYLRNDPMSSEMWQLLRRPVTLEEYNKTVRTEAVSYFYFQYHLFAETN